MRIYFTALVAYLIWLAVHYGVRKLAAKSLVGAAERMGQKLGIRGSLAAAFRANTRPWRSIFSRQPAGWGRRSRRRIQRVLEDADRYVQDLNDRFTNPSGNVPLDLAATGLVEPDDESPLEPAPEKRPAETN
jgi:hypothetical protein